MESVRQLYRLNNQASRRFERAALFQAPPIPKLGHQIIGKSSRLSAQLMPCRLRRTSDATLSAVRLPREFTWILFPEGNRSSPDEGSSARMQTCCCLHFSRRK